VNLEPSEVKKWAGGKGNASKADIRVAMISVFGKWLQTGSRTEDEFDAIAAALAQARKAGWLR
jgi:Holliday junction resolvasome RuvABC endonuclease subunit